MEGPRPDKFRHDAQNADNARKNTAFPPVCKKCAKVCRAPEKGKSHEESCDSSWDFGALEGTRIPGPLIKSQMLYRLSYERILYSKTILPNNITTTRRKKQERSGKKQHNSYPVHFARRAGPRYALPAAARSCGKFLFTNAARTVTIKSTPQGSSSPYAECNSSDDTGAAQIALVRRFFA